ncbi:MAG: hypothetical protein QGI21_06580 [Candidatus Poseidoniaceae archaeon]|jgi:glycosyltransferase involved in cell wall biosynthesis|nr:hypothetical protein [Candidatus Poseidoniaceae archaeon]
MIAWITTWNIKCGIATYSRSLIEHFDDVLVLAQKGEGDVDQAIPCWKRDTPYFEEIIAQIISRNIDTVVIQHQPGLFRFKFLNILLLKLAELEIKVFITLHNTRDRSLIFPSKRIEKAVDGLSTCSTIMVHRESDVENLSSLGIKGNVVMIPHGVYPPPSNKAETIQMHGRTLGTFGFLLPHKGQLELIDAFSKLDNWDSLLMLCATREGTGNTLTKANALIKKHNIGKNVKLITDFIDDEVAIASLANCELLAFPYQNTKESASGAVRMGVASGSAIAVTPIPIFDDIDGAIKMSGNSANQIASSISVITDSQIKESEEKIINLRDSLQWDNISLQIQALLK